MRRIPVITKNLLIINILAFIAMYFLKTVPLSGGGVIDLNDIFGLHFCLSPHFHLYQLFTYMFMHANIEHIFFNMFALWMFGCVVENVWGAKKFLFYYIVCGVGAGLIQEIAQLGSFCMICGEQIPNFKISQMFEVARNSASVINLWTTVGASGAIYAILLAFGMIFPEERIFIFPLPIPIKAKWFVIIYAAIELFSALATTGDNVAHLAHLGGMIFGYFLIRYWQKHPTAGYGRSQGEEFFDNLRNKWEQRTNKKSGYTSSSTSNVDWEYNARKKAEQDEIDHILDKIRKSGYDSLTADEKRKLFDQSNKK